MSRPPVPAPGAAQGTSPPRSPAKEADAPEVTGRAIAGSLALASLAAHAWKRTDRAKKPESARDEADGDE